MFFPNDITHLRFRRSDELDATGGESDPEAPAVPKRIAAIYSTQPPQNSDGGERSRQFAG